MSSLLIITQPFQSIVPCFPKVLAAASQYASKTLYVHFDEVCWQKSSSEHSSLPYRSYILASIYSMCHDIDLRILLDGFKRYKNFRACFNNPIDRVLIDSKSAIREEYKSISKNNTFALFSEEDLIEIADIENVSFGVDNEDIEYDDVVAGGTFDGIHPGHKILLSTALLRTRKRLTIGVATGPLLKNKTLKELIASSEKRIEVLQEFLLDIDRNMDYNLVPITEPMGPTSWDPKMEMIVVSEETKKGVDLINNFRQENHLPKLNQYCIQLYEDCNHNLDEEAKFSSSSLRMRSLGSRIKAVVPNNDIAISPYIVGLTGSSASGKTKIAKRLEDLGAVIIDCDKMGHAAYQKDTDCYYKIMKYFGEDILDADGLIDRKKLGSLVFGNPQKLEELNKLVWPEIATMVQKQIEIYKNERRKVVILDAAVLLKAGWEEMCHEVWVTTLSRAESIKRIVKRDGISEEIAGMRLDQQLSGEELVSKANIVFCSQWSYETTQSQVEKAWNILKEEGIIPASSSSL